MDDMSYTLRYTSSRKEIWKFYWSVWRRRLWIVHALFAAVAGFAVAALTGHGVRLTSWIEDSFLALPFVIGAFAAVPQLRFKGAERTLRVTPEGWSTEIGQVSGSRSWAEVKVIREVDGLIFIESMNGNGIIVPPRAFRDENERRRFLTDVLKWHASHPG